MRALEGLTAIVTGASRGVGRGCALELAARGACVYITGRTLREGDSQFPGSLESCVEEAEGLGGQAIPVVCDHREDRQVEALFERVRAERKELHVLVNNAFSIPDDLDPNAPFWETPFSSWDDMVGGGARSGRAWRTGYAGGIRWRDIALSDTGWTPDSRAIGRG